MKNIIITNWNRDHAKVWFEPVENDNTLYTIHTDEKHQYILEYACVNYDSLPEDAGDYDIIYNMPDGTKVKAHMHSFDPAGGPYIAIGDKYGDKTLERIFVKDKITYFKLV